jgi:hypothetical protein
MNRFLFRLIFSTTVLTGISITSIAQIRNTDLVGAWQTGTDTLITRIFTDKIFVYAAYNVKSKQFMGTAGGRWKIDKGTLLETYEFNTRFPDRVGKTSTISIVVKNNNQLVSSTGDYAGQSSKSWSRLDDGSPGRLAGAWLITGRMNDGVFHSMTPGARRTMKILSGTRFQWIAYNVEANEFFGTGGGTYTTENGKYTENIEFFSRDNNRVGAILKFDYSLENGDWHHQGVSSKGDTIHEIWAKREKTGL